MARAKTYTIDENDPRVPIVVAAGALRAEEVWTKDGWRKAPAQCPIFVDAIKGATHSEFMALADAWLSAFRAGCLKYENAALAD